MALATVLLIVGFAFVVAEVFFVSMGIFSVIAGACIVSADIIAFQHSGVMGWTFLAIQAVGIPLLVWGAFRALPRLPFGRRMLLTGPETAPSGGFPTLEHLEGTRGTALTDLRPSGTAELDGRRTSVVAVDTWIPKDSTIEVVLVHGTEIKVRALETPDDDA